MTNTRINSRSKGNRGERAVAKLFEAWTKKEFARTPSSGGLSWKSSNSKGDIVCTTEGHYFPFCIEVKVHREIDFSHLINPKIKTPKILEFWEQCNRDAEKAKKIPMLLMRYDNMPKGLFYLAIPLHIATKGEILAGLGDTPYLLFNHGRLRLAIIPSTNFFKSDYKKLKIIAKKSIKTIYAN